MLREQPSQARSAPAKPGSGLSHRVGKPDPRAENATERIV